jgi:hypothetical protein
MSKTRILNKTITTVLILLLTVSILRVINININIIGIPQVYGTSIPTGSATYLYVNTTHWSNATAVYPSSTPLVHALGNATGGTTIDVMPGQYNGTYNVNTAGLYLVSNQSASNTVINAYNLTITASDVTISGFTFISTAGDHHVVVIDSSSSALDNVTITSSVFNLTRTTSTIGISIGEQTTNNKVSNVAMSYNTFNGPADKIANPWKIGGWFGNPVGCEVETVEFENNTVYNCSIPINLHDKNITDMLISGNTFRNTDGVVYVWETADNPTGKLSHFVFTNNDVDSTNTYGVGIDTHNKFTDANFGDGNRINYNNFVGIPGGYGFNATSILSSLTTYKLNATLNWWGNATGPHHSTTNPSGAGCAVSDYVDYIPWLLKPYPPAVLVPELYVDSVTIESPSYGKNLTTDIKLDNAADLYGFEFKLYWNTTLLDLVDVNLTPPWVNYTPGTNQINETIGRYWLGVSALAPSPSFNGSATLATLTFKITYVPVYPENVSCLFDFNETVLGDPDGNPIPHIVYDGEYTCYAARTKIQVLPQLSEAKALNQVFNLSINVANVANLHTFEFELQYNTTLLDAKEMTVTSFPDRTYKISKKILDDTQGLVTLRVESISPPLQINETLELASVTFEVTNATTWPKPPIESDFSFGFTELKADTGAVDHDKIGGLYRYRPIPGDMNSNGVVNIMDLAMVARAYGTRPGDPKWNELVDLNHDNIINILDLIPVARNYGRTD